ncbi:MAG: hypothetical protein WBF87_13965 [Mesorhizobium sp.]
MDVDALLQGVIRFSNFMTSRLLVSGVVAYVISGFIPIGNETDGFLPSVDLLNGVVQNYQNIFDTLGVSDFAILLILFIFLTTIHVIYTALNAIGRYLPPAIVPISGWVAVERVTAKPFDTLRRARGDEETEDENQRLYEFKQRLRAMEKVSRETYRERLERRYETFRVSKAFVLLSLIVWVYVLVFGGYSSNPNLLLAICALSLVVALLAGFSIMRANQERIFKLRRSIVAEIIEFASIWTDTAHQRMVADDCMSDEELRSASLAVVVPVFGTLDSFQAEVRRWRGRGRTT